MSEEKKLNKIAFIVCVLVSISYGQSSSDTTCWGCNDSTGNNAEDVEEISEMIKEAKEVFKAENWVAQNYDTSSLNTSTRINILVQDFTNIFRASLMRRKQRMNFFMLNHSDADKKKIEEAIKIVEKKNIIPESRLLISKIEKISSTHYKVTLGADMHYLNILVTERGEHLIVDSELQKTLNWLVQ